MMEAGERLLVVAAIVAGAVAVAAILVLAGVFIVSGYSGGG